MDSLLQAIRLIEEIRRRFAFEDALPGVSEIVAAIDATDRRPKAGVIRSAQIPNHESYLYEAIQNITPPRLAPIRTAIQEALPTLCWRIDDGIYYEGTADVGEAYKSGNMHCELIGPDAGVFVSGSLRLGLFMLAPATLYRDHAHAAGELYLNLTGPSEWRFGDDHWRELAADSVVWNPPWQAHATCVGSRAFLSVYAWTGDIHGLCRVVPRDDWFSRQAQLRELDTSTSDD